MEKKNNLLNYIWPVVIAIILFLLLVGVMLLFNNQNQTTDTLSEIKTTLSPEEELTQASLFNLTPQSAEALKPADKIIIKTVNFDGSGNIAEIIMYSPTMLADAKISIEGIPVGVQQIKGENSLILGFQIPELSRKKSITFLVDKNGNQVITCTLSNGETLQVSGDCLF